MSESISIIGQVNFRDDRRQFGIKQPDRLHHMFIIGKTGTGKTTLMKNLLLQDIAAGRGCAFLDPHGDMVDEAAETLPEMAKDQVIYLNALDPAQPWGYNPLAHVAPLRRPLLASGVMEILKKQWDGRSWGARMEHILRNVLLTLLDQKEANFSDIPRLLQDRGYRTQAIRSVQNPAVREFWLQEFAKYSYRLKADAVAPILNKVGGYLSNPILREILCGQKQPIRLRRVMDEGRVLLVNLAKGSLGEDASNLLGSLLLTSLGLAAYSRADQAEKQRKPFFIYADEFHSFSTLSTASMMAELRKYATGMIAAVQHLSQIDPEIRDAVLGNAGTLISFRLGPSDATFLQKEFFPTFAMEDFLNLANYEMYIRLMIDGKTQKGFSATTIP